MESREGMEARRRELLEKRRDFLLSKSQMNPSNPQKDNEYTFGQRAGQFGAGLGDTVAGLSDLASGGIDYTNLNKMFPKSQEDREIPNISAQERWNETVNSLAGRNLAPSDTTGKLLRTTGQFALPFGSLGKAKGVWNGIKGFAKSHLAPAVGASAALNLTPPLTEEGTGWRAAEDIAKAIAGSALAGKLVNGSALTRSEQSVVDKLVEVAGSEEAANEIINNIQKYESKIGYEPTLAEVAGSPNLAQLQRSREGVIGSGIAEKNTAGNIRMREALSNVIPEKTSVSALQDYVGEGLRANEGNIESAKMAFQPRATAAEAGLAVQESLHGKVRGLKSARSEATKPRWEALKQHPDKVKATSANEIIDNELLNAKGSLRDDLIKAKKLLTSNDVSRNPGSKLPRASSKWTALEESKISGKPMGGTGKLSDPRIGELQSAKQSISDEIKSAKISGKYQKSKILMDVKRGIEKDMEAYPEAASINAQYHELSKPISEITGKAALNKIIKRDVYNKDFVLNPSSVPEIFVGTSKASIDNAKELLKHIDNPSHELLKNYTNGQAIDAITDSTGRVKLPALEQFIKGHKGKGLEAVHPELFDIKLKNLKNAQLFANQYYKKTRAVADTFYKNEFNEYVGSEVSKNVGNKIFNNKSGSVAKYLVDEISKDKTGNSINGLRRYSADYILKNIENAGMEGKNQILSYDKMRKFKQNHKDAMNTIFDKHQTEVFDEIEDILKRRNYAATVGSAKGSPTSANIQNSSAADLMQWGKDSAFVRAAKFVGIPGPVAKKTMDYLSDLSTKGYKDALDNALVDPKYAEFLLSHPLKNKESANLFIGMAKKYGKPSLNVLSNKEYKRKEEK